MFCISKKILLNAPTYEYLVQFIWGVKGIYDKSANNNVIYSQLSPKLVD